MQVLESCVTGMAYDADFGRVEAAVALVVLPGQGAPARTLQMRTSQPLHGTAPLEERLTRDAIRLATALTA